MTTALAIVQQVGGELGILQPSSGLYTSTDPQVQQLAALANAAGTDLARRHQWTAITKATTFVTLGQQLQTSFIPSDFDRFCNDSMWNTSIVRKCYGPLTEQEWQQYQAYPIFTSVNPAFIIRGGNLYFQPAPSAGQTISYSYVSTQWCTSSGGTGQTAFAADTDIPLLPVRAIILAIKWLYKMAKGFDYSQEFEDYESEVAQFIARDGGAPKLNLTYGLNRFQPYPYNVPEGNWP